MSSDLDMLKAVVDNATTIADNGEARWDAADQAVNDVLSVLRRSRRTELWSNVYEAIRAAYVGGPDWGEEDDAETTPLPEAERDG